MAESALFQSYRATEKQRAAKALDEALGRLEAQPVDQPAASEPVAPSAVPEARIIRETSESVRQPGIFESLKRGFRAIPQRFMESIDTVGGVFRPLTPAERNEDPVDPHGLVLQRSQGEKILQHPATRFVLGGINALFPFSAFAGETGGDLGRWLEVVTQNSTDATLKARLADVDRRIAGVEGGADQPYSPWGGPAMQATRRRVLGSRVGTEKDPLFIEKKAIEGLLTIPEEERLEHVRQMSGIAAEVLSGIIPGFTSTKPSRR